MSQEIATSLPTPCSSDQNDHLRGSAEPLVNFLIACEREMEDEMKAHGVQRFKDSLHANKSKGRETNTAAGLAALRQSIEPVSKTIEAWIEEASRKRGNKHIALRILKEVGPEEAALLISKSILDTLSSKTSAMRMAKQIAGMLLDELRYRKFKAACPGLFEWKLRNFDTTSYQHMKRSLDASLHFAKVDVSEYQLSEEHRVYMGNLCLDIFIRSTHKQHLAEDGVTVCDQCPNHGYVQIERKTLGRREGNETNVVATQDTIDWVRKIEAALMFLGPTYRPTMIPPKPWTNTRDGGYWFSLTGKFPLLRTDGRHKLDDLDSVHMPVVYESLNSIQDTSWSINARVLEVVEALRNRLEPPPHDVLPSAMEEPEPVKPAIMGTRTREEERQFLADVVSTWTTEEQQSYRDTVKGWRNAASEVHERNHTRKIKTLILAHITATAKTLLEVTDHDGQPLPFYFPHNLDFRGRVYPIPLYLQPQGDDLQKGLLQFGQGKRLGTPEAADWLAVHGANCLAEYNGAKLDKLALEDRIRWIHEHTDLIEQIAAEPLAHLEWTAADSPFCFLAFCFEWAGYRQNKLEHISYIPISMDGSCNGLQHYSAMLRDAVGGAAVNLVPSEQPQDIYRRVAEQVVERLTAAAITKDNQFAIDWLRWGKIDRKFVKRQVMTLPYGSKKYGFKAQIKEFLKGLPRTEQPDFMHGEGNDGFKHLHYIAGVIWDSLSGVVVAATEGMAWLQSLARICAKEDLPICWTAPNGLPVVQGYRQETTIRVDTTLVGLRFAPTLTETTKLLDHSKQVSGIAPNVVHSLDASAMMLTVVAAKARGITHFAMIHDSYGTHAADAPLLAQITREEFVRMYDENDVLTMVEEGLMANVDRTQVKQYPSKPALGGLDLTSVKHSKYFFA